MSARLAVEAHRSRPDLRRHVGVCMSCRHWQIDIRPGAIADLGGWQQALREIGEAHAAHVGMSKEPDADICPGAGGRIKYGDQWVEPPLMESGNVADGTLEIQPLPRWWVTK